MQNRCLFIAQLSARLDALAESPLHAAQIVQPISLTECDELLAWLGAQTLYPSFYWHHRDKAHTMAAWGKVTTFDNWLSAERWLQTHNTTDWRIYGLMPFQVSSNSTLTTLFLPRFECVLRDGVALFKINLLANPTLKGDIARTKALLAQLKQPQPTIEETNTLLTRVDSPNMSAWQNLIEETLTTIAHGELSKVVLARKTTLELANTINPIQIMMNSQQINQHCYHFMFRFDNKQAFLGSTPERLFYRHDHQVITEALAGTVINSEDHVLAEQLQQWLRDNKKNHNENALVVKDICQQLSSLTTYITVHSADIVRLRNVQHLRHRITAELSTIADHQCLEQLHPTAAVAGLPRQEALAFINHHEPFDREWYAGTVGYLSQKESEFAVALRSVLLNDNWAHLYAGAGIVAGSDPLLEWEEINNKMLAMLSLIEATTHTTATTL